METKAGRIDSGGQEPEHTSELNVVYGRSIRFGAPSEDWLRFHGEGERIDSIRNEIAEALEAAKAGQDWKECKNTFNRIDAKVMKWADSAYAKGKYYCCRASFGNHFPGLYHTLGTLKGGLEGEWQRLKREQENPKWWGGDANSNPGGEYGRSVSVGNSPCVICEITTTCIQFEDNESYGTESLCGKCLKACLKLLDGQESGRKKR